MALVFIVIAILARILKFSSFSFLLQPFSFILLAALALGAARYQNTIPKFDAFHIAFYNDRDYELLITGTLVEPPDYRDTYTNLRVDVQKVDTGDSELPVHGLILVRVTNNQTFHYGDVLRFRVRLVVRCRETGISHSIAVAHIGSNRSS